MLFAELEYVGTPKMFHELPMKGGRTPKWELKSEVTEKFPDGVTPLWVSASLGCLSETFELWSCLGLSFDGTICVTLVKTKEQKIQKYDF